MDNNLTISGLAFNLQSNGATGSVRRETSRGVNLPEIMTIRHENYVDSKTKVPGVKSVCRFDRALALSNGVIANVTCYTVTMVPTDTGVTSSDVQAVVERQIHTLQEDDSGLNLATAIFVDRQQ